MASTVQTRARMIQTEEPRQADIARPPRAPTAIVGGWLFAAAGGQLCPRSISGSLCFLQTNKCHASSLPAPCRQRFGRCLFPHANQTIVKFHALQPPSESTSSIPSNARPKLLQSKHGVAMQTSRNPISHTYIDLPILHGSGGTSAKVCDRTVASRLCSAS